jgi:hypothetical protein
MTLIARRPACDNGGSGTVMGRVPLIDMAPLTGG